MEYDSSILEFNWDKGNLFKNWSKHNVSPIECEQVFFNQPLLINEDIKHSKSEKRYLALGETDKKRLLFISFTVRLKKIRIISARDMNKNEKKKYAKA